MLSFSPSSGGPCAAGAANAPAALPGAACVPRVLELHFESPNMNKTHGKGLNSGLGIGGFCTVLGLLGALEGLVVWFLLSFVSTYLCFTLSVGSAATNQAFR